LGAAQVARPILGILGDSLDGIAAAGDICRGGKVAGFEAGRARILLGDNGLGNHFWDRYGGGGVRISRK
jgi:hypothetical protein